MTRDVGKDKLFEPERKNSAIIKQQVLLFCSKHPRMKFTAECIPLDNKEERTRLKEELQALVAKEIISQQTTDSGVVFYCSNRPQQELVRMSQNYPERSEGSRKDAEILRYTQNDIGVKS